MGLTTKSIEFYTYVSGDYWLDETRRPHAIFMRRARLSRDADSGGPLP
jgi:hypothetical protein